MPDRCVISRSFLWSPGSPGTGLLQDRFGARIAPLDPEGNQFFIASLEATYTGTESSTFWIDMRLKSVGDSNVAYDAYCGVIPDDIDDSGETFPGGTITGNVCWSIQSTDAASLVMIVEESFNFDGTRAFFALAN